MSSEVGVGSRARLYPASLSLVVMLRPPAKDQFTWLLFVLTLSASSCCAFDPFHAAEAKHILHVSYKSFGLLSWSKVSLWLPFAGWPPRCEMAPALMMTSRGRRCQVLAQRKIWTQALLGLIHPIPSSHVYKLEIYNLKIYGLARFSSRIIIKNMEN